MITTTIPRPISDDQRCIVLQLLDLALRTPKEVADVFVDWTPHTNGIAVRIHDQGWFRNLGWQFEGHVYFDEPEHNDIAALLARVKAHLAEITTSQHQHP